VSTSVYGGRGNTTGHLEAYGSSSAVFVVTASECEMVLTAVLGLTEAFRCTLREVDKREAR